MIFISSDPPPQLLTPSQRIAIGTVAIPLAHRKFPAIPIRGGRIAIKTDACVHAAMVLLTVQASKTDGFVNLGWSSTSQTVEIGVADLGAI